MEGRAEHAKEAQHPRCLMKEKGIGREKPLEGRRNGRAHR